uniref:Uncharacterized protein n=1 Tax=Plectus sambesii TaxID=2011161 RepID=A0A914WBZ1_9BILA
MLKLVVFFALFCPIYSALLNCQNPWQTEMRSGGKIVACTASNQSPCAKGRNGVCVYTFNTYSYICCEDLANSTSPICPKFYDTIKMPCSTLTTNSCPTGYKCMSAINYNGTICCKSAPNTVYPEPSSSFIYSLITPKFLPKAPTTILKLNNWKHAQEVQVAELTTQPNVTFTPKDNTTYYSLIAFDISVATPAAPQWMVVNARSNSTNKNQLDLTTDGGAVVSKSWVAYVATTAPAGEHVIVFALYEQLKMFTSTAGPEKSPVATDIAAPWDVAGNFTTKFSTVLGNIVAGTYVTVLTTAA